MCVGGRMVDPGLEYDRYYRMTMMIAKWKLCLVLAKTSEYSDKSLECTHQKIRVRISKHQSADTKLESGYRDLKSQSSKIDNSRCPTLVQSLLTPQKGRGWKKIYNSPERKNLALFMTENAKNCDISLQDLAKINYHSPKVVKKALYLEGIFLFAVSDGKNSLNSDRNKKKITLCEKWKDLALWEVSEGKSIGRKGRKGLGSPGHWRNRQWAPTRATYDYALPAGLDSPIYGASPWVFLYFFFILFSVRTAS